MKIEIGFSLIYTLCDLDPLYREYNIMANSTYARNANIIVPHSKSGVVPMSSLLGVG
jgi:hypothetical protein